MIDAHKKPISYRKYLIYLKIILTGVIFWVLIHNAQLNLGLVAAIFENPLASVTVVALCFAMVIVHSFRWSRLNFAQGLNLSFLQTITPTYLGIAFNSVLPGSVGGDFVRLYYILKKFPQKKSNAILAILVDRICGLLGIFVIACAVAPYYLSTFHHDSTMYYLLVACISFSVTALVVFFGTILLLSEKVGLIDWLTRRFTHKRWSAPLISFLQAIYLYRNSKRVILESITASLFTQLLLLVTVVVITKMMGLPVLSLGDFMIALVVGQVASLLPLTPGGIGVGEAVFGNIILLLNPGTTAAYATVFFVLRILSAMAYLPGVLLGVFGFHLLHKDGAEVATSSSL